MKPTVMPDPAGMKDWWRVYDARYDEAQAALLGLVRSLPGLNGLLSRMSATEIEKRSADARETLKVAVDGNWEPLLAQWNAQGPTYAAFDVPFAEWFELAGVFQQTVIPYLVRDLGGEPERLSRALAAMAAYANLAMGSIGEAYLNAKERIIFQQQEAIHELSTPVLQVRDRLLLIPIVGMLDTHRARQLTEALLHAVREHRAKAVVIDITGVAAVDSKVANHLFQTVAAVRLMGAASIVTGLSAEVAQALVVLGIDVDKLNTAGDLQGGLEAANRMLAPGNQRIADWSDGHARPDSETG
jgi:anti-anti-sigma regulatory factor